MTTRDLDSAMFQRGEAFALLTVIARWRRLGLAPADMLRRLAEKCEDESFCNPNPLPLLAV